MIPAPGSRPTAAPRVAASRDRYAAIMSPPTPDRRHLRHGRAPQHRVGADRSARPATPTPASWHERSPHEGVTVGRIDGTPRPPRGRDGGIRRGLRAGRSRRQHGRPRPDTRRPDPRVDRRRAGRDAGASIPDLEAWLRGRWERRGMPFPESQPQAGLADPIVRAAPEPERLAPRAGSSAAPGRRRRGRAAGPAARDAADVVGRGAAPACGRAASASDVAVRTFRLTGIGESTVAEILGEELLRRSDPEVATYARARGRRCPGERRGAGRGRRRAPRSASRRPPRSSVSASATTSGPRATRPGPTRSGRGWPDSAGGSAVEEIGTGGQVAALFGDVPWLALVEAHPSRGRAAG